MSANFCYSVVVVGGGGGGGGVCVCVCVCVCVYVSHTGIRKPEVGCLPYLYLIY